MPRNTSGLKRDAGPGRPKGSRDKHPRSAKRAIEALLEDFGNDVALIESVIRKGLTARPPTSFPYLRLIVEQNAGAPEQDVNVRTVVKHVYETLEGRG